MKWLFSTAQQAIVDSYVPTMLCRGYKYYVAYTHVTIGDYYTRPEPDLYFVFSSEPITANSGYRYEVPEGSVMVRVRSSNYSTSSYGDNSERFVQIDYSGNLSIPVYEHIYTNAVFTGATIQPDIMREGSQQNVIQTESVCTVLAAFLLVFCFWKMWTIHR